MVGEIRALAAAELTFKGALSGHGVWSTLHANSAPAIITRFRDMGVQPYMLADPELMKGLISQRLFRKLCPHCRRQRAPEPYELKLLGVSSERPVHSLYEAVGCPACEQQGYKGRMAIMELLRMDPELDELVARRATAREIREAASRKGFRPLADDGTRRVLEGATTLDELCRVVNLTDRMSP